ESRIWHMLESKDINQKNKRIPLEWTHGTYKLGSYWLNILEYEDRALCPTCLMTESIEHIITACPATGQETVWNIASKIWSKTGQNWPTSLLGMILGSSSATFKTREGKPNSDDNWLYHILVTKSAHLIWKMRCEWRIRGGGDPNPDHSDGGSDRNWKH
ncbi:hypothetical protein M422DRAFT_106905, partial [Sphaerobolus stellatus SS14]